MRPIDLFSDALLFATALCLSIAFALLLFVEMKGKRHQFKGTTMLCTLRPPELFRQPNPLTNGLQRRRCGACDHQGLIDVPFGAACPSCDRLQIVSVDAVRYESLKPGEEFYLVGHYMIGYIAYPYVVWSKHTSVVVSPANGRQMTMNARCSVGHDVLLAIFPQDTFVVPVRRALIGDRFSFN